MKPDLCDIAAGFGSVFIVAGVWWLHPPAGLIAAGVVLLIAGWLGAATPKGSK